jgi:hypothetical protein
MLTDAECRNATCSPWKAVTDLDHQIREFRLELQCAQAENCDLRDRVDALETNIAQPR